MTIEVIERGELPEKKRYELRCLHCRTRFSFLREDAQYWSSVRNEEGLKIACPVCRRDCYTDGV